MASSMQTLLQSFTLGGNISHDVETFFTLGGRSDVFSHSQCVAKLAGQLARRFEVDESQAYLAGLLHDLGRIIKESEAVDTCKNFELAVLPEEHEYTGILHQKLSPFLAREAFGTIDNEVLAATQCHTTLKARATKLDKVVFLADKLSWSDSEAGFRSAVEQALDVSLDHGVLMYIEWLLLSNPRVIHPWLIAAHKELVVICRS